MENCKGDLQEWNPQDVLCERCHQPFVSNSIFQKRMCNVSAKRKDEQDRHPDLERREISVFDVDLPTKDEIIDKGQRE
jgi:hypothetical protein